MTPNEFLLCSIHVAALATLMSAGVVHLFGMASGDVVHGVGHRNRWAVWGAAEILVSGVALLAVVDATAGGSGERLGATTFTVGAIYLGFFVYLVGRRFVDGPYASCNCTGQPAPIGVFSIARSSVYAAVAAVLWLNGSTEVIVDAAVVELLSAAFGGGVVGYLLWHLPHLVDGSLLQPAITGSAHG